ncbi:mitochondrial assembly of ribosomal large subunit protein 1 isoform X2 [Brachyhypopomus gauderio]|uniref:mitochondrial assembly of ribosomal large subunit protein 1 isoform X2 n=1 Tax=Brachyhypopomus gauderio TaxID=698409 RepID=UPI0040435C0E
MNTIHCSKRAFSKLLNQFFCMGRNARKVRDMHSLGFPHINAHISNDLSLYTKPRFVEENRWFSTKSRSVNGLYFTTESAHARPQHHSGDVFNIDVLVSLLRQEKAVDVCVIRVSQELKYAEYFIVVTGSSTRHLKAMALYAIKVYKFMKRDCDPDVLIEGMNAEDWMCIDFGAMVVHFMLPETRDVYELEKLWTLRSYDEQLRNIPPQRLPADFIFDAETE